MPIRMRWRRDWQPVVSGLAEEHLDDAAEVVLAGMRRRIPRSTDGSNGRPPGYAASRLHIRRGVDTAGRYRDVGTDATSQDGYPYPLALEHGTKPHVIVSKGPWPLRDPRTGRVFGRRVMHPGTRPIPWARPSLFDLRGREFR
jgi:hypothetical protein